MFSIPSGKLSRLALLMLGPMSYLLSTTPFQQQLQTTCDPVYCGYQIRPELSHNWGPYSPWFSVESEIPPAIPAQCTVTFAQAFLRHGSRDPTQHKTETYRNLTRKIQRTVQDYGAGYEFIRDYHYNLGSEHLTAYGRKELFNAGIQFFERYKQLSSHHAPFIRASGQDRVVDSAHNWTLGFQQMKYPGLDIPLPMIVISEEHGYNTTLDHSLCDAFESEFNKEMAKQAGEKWRAVFLQSTRTRVNEHLPGANLSETEIIYLMDMCPFNTVASPDGRMSPFCDLFSAAEWQDYGYYMSLNKYYRYGAGDPLGPTQGVGYVNELIARLTGQPVRDHTSSNTTLDSDPVTFPLGRALYADFSHDNTLVGVFFALGLYNSTQPLSNTTREDVNETNGYSASTVVPFASRAYFEKLKCDDFPGEEMIRVLVNDRVIPLETCGGDRLGRCSLSNFISSLSFAEQGGLWDQCFK